MTDHEFYQELRRGLLLVMRAVMRRYGVSWADFLPTGTVVSAAADEWGQETRTPTPTFRQG
jgi:hypothetical protein